MKIRLVLDITLETEDGAPLSEARRREIENITHDTVRSRLFGEGFLPGDVLVDEYRITFEPT